MNRVRDGHLADLSELFERYHVRMYNFMLKLTYDRTVSQDLTQTLFYRIIKYRSTFSDRFTFKSWIFRLARNVHADYCKKQKKQTDRYVHVEKYNPDMADEVSDFSEDDFHNLDRAFAKLSPEQKEILVLSRFQGLKYSEISLINKESVASVKVQVHRAIKQLRNIYFKLT